MTSLSILPVIALWIHCIPCSMASIPWFPLWLFFAICRKCCEAGLLLFFFSPAFFPAVFCTYAVQTSLCFTPQLYITVPQIFITEEHILPTRSSNVHIQPSRLAVCWRVDSPEQPITFIVCCPKLGIIIKSFHISNFRKQMFENAVQSSEEYINVCGLYCGKAGS